MRRFLIPSRKTWFCDNPHVPQRRLVSMTVPSERAQSNLLTCDPALRQGLNWYAEQLREDRDGDTADEFLVEPCCRASRATAHAGAPGREPRRVAARARAAARAAAHRPCTKGVQPLACHGEQHGLLACGFNALWPYTWVWWCRGRSTWNAPEHMPRSFRRALPW